MLSGRFLWIFSLGDKPIIQTRQQAIDSESLEW